MQAVLILPGGRAILPNAGGPPRRAGRKHPEPALSTRSDPPPAALIAQLRRRRLLPPGAVPQPLAGGRSNHVWRLRGAGIDRVLKLYPGPDGNPLFGNDPDRETACLTALAGTGLAPDFRAKGTVAGAGWVLYDHAPGRCWRRDPAPVARLLAAVHRQPAVAGLPAGPDGSADLARQTRAILAQCASPMAAELLTQEPPGAVAPSGRRSLLHGDPVPGNILTRAGHAMLIDWQCPVLGDPSADLAIFASPAMQMLYRGAPLQQDELEGFLAAYPDPEVARRYRALRPWHHWRIAAYCLWQSERGRQAYRRALSLERAQLAAYSPARKSARPTET